MQTEELAGRKPIFLAGLECLLRLADHLKLIVAEKLFQGSLDTRQFWRNRLWLCDIFRDDESTPHRLCAPQSRGRAEDEGETRNPVRRHATHKQLFGRVIGRQTLQSLCPKNGHAVLFYLKH